MSDPTIAIIAIPILAALALLFWAGWQRRGRTQASLAARQAREAEIELARHLPLPERAEELQPNAAAWSTTPMVGKIMLVLSGTFAAKLGLRLLRMMAQCDVDQAIGSILLIELDEWRRQDFMAHLPPVYADRLVVASCATLGAGGANQPLEAIDRLKRYWKPEILRCVHDVCDLHQRRDPRCHEAAQIIPFISLGSTGYIGATAIEHIKRRFQNAQCIGFTAYPHHDRLRGRTPQVLAAYTAAGCHGFIAADNLPDETAPERDFLINDMGMMAIIVGLIAGTRNADAVTETNNTFTLVLPEEPGGIASFRTYMTTLPAYTFQPHPALDPRYYVIRDATVAACLNALEEVSKDNRKAVGADFGHERTSRFDILLIPLEPRSLVRVHDDLRTALQTVEPLPPNYDLFMSGTRSPIDPERPTCPILVVSLEALTDPKSHLQAIAQPLLTGRTAPTIPALAPHSPPVSENGHVPEVDVDSGTVEEGSYA